MGGVMEIVEMFEGAVKEAEAPVPTEEKGPEEHWSNR